MGEMRHKELPNCCGITVVMDFGWTTTNYGGPHRPRKERVAAFLKQEKQTCKTLDHGALMAVLNTTQLRHLGETFEQMGFFPVCDDIPNPAHKTRMHVLMWVNQKNLWQKTSTVPVLK